MDVASSVSARAAATRRERLLVSGAGLAVTIIAWLWLVRSVPAPGMAAVLTSRHPLALAIDARSFLYVILMWEVMMIAMMTPPLVRWIIGLGLVMSDARHERSHTRFVAAFAGGYFTVWLIFSGIAAAMQVALQRVGFDAMHGRGTPLPGVILILAGLFQLTPLKEACLAHCRSPLGYLLARWKNGPPGGFRLGLGHGRYCLGCCWALMITAFALGLMNLLWMAVLTVIVCVEQLAPHGDRIGRAVGLVLAGWGLVLLFGTA